MSKDNKGFISKRSALGEVYNHKAVILIKCCLYMRLMTERVLKTAQTYPCLQLISFHGCEIVTSLCQWQLWPVFQEEPLITRSWSCLLGRAESKKHVRKCYTPLLQWITSREMWKSMIWGFMRPHCR